MWGIPAGDLGRKTRRQPHPWARFMAAWVLNELGYSRRASGVVLGLSDRSSVIWAIRQVEKWFDTDDALLERLDRMVVLLTTNPRTLESALILVLADAAD